MLETKPIFGWLFAVVLAFVVVLSASLTFEYADGDDASMIAFHALGRDAALQPPYSPYHSMMDALLGLLPARERLLRTTAISVSAASAVMMTLLMLALAFDWLRPLREIPRLPSALAVLLAIPELFYLGLVLIPSLTAMSLVLLAHLVARRALHGRAPSSSRLILAAALFGVGAAFRWDTVTYGAIIVADLATSPLEDENSPGRLHRRPGTAILWGALALLAFFVAVAVSGYRPADVWRVARFGVGFSASRPPFSAPALAALQSLLTPGFGLFTLVGLWSLVRRRPRLAVIVVLGALLVAPWMVTGVPKYFLVALPGLVTAFILGFSQAWGESKEHTALVRILIVLCLSLPWVVGLRIAYEGSSWGPGFELRPFTSSVTNGWEPTFGPGSAVPTPEGPRPIYGHLPVLLGGRWRHLLHDLALERSNVIQTAAERKLPILRLRGSNGFDTAELVAQGFATHDSARRRSPRVALLLERRFQNPRGARITYLRTERLDFLRSGAVLESLSRAYGSRMIILSYPSDLRRLYQCAPQAFEPLGPLSSALDLAELRRHPC